MNGINVLEVIWEFNTHLLTHILSKTQIYSLIPNIYKKNEFTIAGDNIIKKMKIQGSFINTIESYKLNEINIDKKI